MKWVDAKQLPLENGRYFVIGRFFPYTEQIRKACVVFADGYFHVSKDNTIIEWLDESEEIGIKDKEIERLKELIAMLWKYGELDGSYEQFKSENNL